MKDLVEKLKIYGVGKSLLFLAIDIKRKLWNQLIRASYSQQGEDLIIDKLLGYKKRGFYVDVGAYDPHRFSNTKRFYLKGWRGINVEPDASNYKKFIRDRKRDINLNLGIGSDNTSFTFYRFFPDTLSTFSKKEADRYKKQGYQFVNAAYIPVKKLSIILKTYRKNKPIDFITIDAEGYDLEVIKSNDWNKYKPKIICVETNQKTQKINAFLKNQKYRLVHQNKVNSIYILK